MYHRRIMLVTEMSSYCMNLGPVQETNQYFFFFFKNHSILGSPSDDKSKAPASAGLASSLESNDEGQAEMHDYPTTGIKETCHVLFLLQKKVKR